MNITITPTMFDIFINLLTVCIGIDFIWCSFWFQIKNEIPNMPKLLGYLVFRLFEASTKRSKSNNKAIKSLFSLRAASIYLLLGGFNLIISSVIAIVILSHKL